jgi:hypothetical protein
LDAAPRFPVLSMDFGGLLQSPLLQSPLLQSPLQIAQAFL